MNVRFAKEEDLNQIKYIWKYCFNDSDSFMNYYFEDKYKKENTLVVEEDNKLVSSLQLNQYNIVLNNKVYAVSYVVGVSTLPEGRGMGYMKILMKRALEDMYERGQLVSILMPIDYRLYRYYGYEHCYDQLEYKIDIELLKDFKTNGKFKRACTEDISYLISIYNNSIKGKNGFTLRDESYFKNLFKEIESEDGYIYIHHGESGFDGYIVYLIMNGNLYVREIFYENIDSLSSILKFLYNHNTQYKNVIISSPLDDKIRFIFPNLKDIDIKVKPFMMGRIINFEKFIKSLEVNNLSCNFNLKVEDKFIDENNKIFNISIENNKIDVVDSDKEDICIDINTLSQLAFSYIDVDEAVFLNKIKIKNENSLIYLKQIFNNKINYINEYV